MSKGLSSATLHLRSELCKHSDVNTQPSAATLACMVCVAVYPLLIVCAAHLVILVTQPLARLVVARPRSHIHLACAGGEAVLRRGTHAGVVAREAREAADGSKV